MERYKVIVSWIILILLFYPVYGHCELDVDMRGQVSSLFILRDTDGFQNTFMDELYGVQWRNEVQFDLTLKPVYAGVPTYYLDKVFFSYRGAYDAIIALRDDRYEGIQKHKSDDYELGRRDIQYENDLRESFIDLVAEHGMQKVNLRLGRQIVRWGEANGFNIINVVCPNDNSYQMFFMDPDDLATPLWMGRLNFNVMGLGIFDTFGIEAIAIPDIRPTINAPLNMEQPFAPIDFSAPYAFAFAGLSQFGPVTKITEDVPGNSWGNMEYALSLLFGIGGLEAALHYFVGHQDNPAIDFSNFYLPLALITPEWELIYRHPRQRVYGFSFNYFMAWANAVLRGEGAVTDEASLMDLSEPFPLFSGYDWISEHKTYQVLLGFDKSLHPKWIGTDSALDINAELYWKHVDDWYTSVTAHPFNKEDTGVATLMAYTDYRHGTIKPTVFVMYDTEGTWMTNASLAYDPDGKWLFSITQMSFWGNKNAISDFSYGGALIESSEMSFKVAYRF